MTVKEIKCKDCQNFKSYYNSCDSKKCQVDPDKAHKCSEAIPIESRELWIARQEWGDLYLYLSEPYFDGKWGRECWTVKIDAPQFPNGSRSKELPSYLYPEITFENSPKKLNPICQPPKK